MKAFLADLSHQQWRDKALCARPEYRTLTWFPAYGESAGSDGRRRNASLLRRLRQVCSMCPVQVQCRDYAEKARVTAGVWAGKNYGRVQEDGGEAL